MSYQRLWTPGGLIVPSSYRPLSIPATPQRSPLPAHLEAMVRNQAGGFAFKLDKWEGLERFLILGSESGTYYVNPPALTRENTKNLMECIEEDGQRVAMTVLRFDRERRCPKRGPLLWALALCSVSPNYLVRADAFEAASHIVRTGTDLFEFVAYREALGGGWGRSMRRFVSNWYQEKDPEKLLYQLLKYKQRGGWSHRDLLRLAKPVPKDLAHESLYGYAVGNTHLNLPPREDWVLTLAGLEYAHDNPDKPDVGLIGDQDIQLSWEMLPTQWLADPKVWGSLIEYDRLPPMALLRNLGRMTANGTFREGWGPLNEQVVMRKFQDPEWVKRSRLHPVSILNAKRVYERGQGERGKLSWKPAPSIVGALDFALWSSFSFVRPIDKKLLVALDVSGSMTADVQGMAGLSAIDAGLVLSKALLMQTPGNYRGVEAGAKLLPGADSSSFVVFDTGVAEVKGLESCRSLADMVGLVKKSGVWNGGTDVAQPLLHELVLTSQGKGHDAVVILTDGETWAGNVHVVQVWKAIRQLNPKAKLVLAAMTASFTTLAVESATPFDSHTLNAIGLDAGLLQVVEQFVGGEGGAIEENE